MIPRQALLLGTALALAGCGSLSKLSEVGKPPPFSPVVDPTKDPAWRPVSMPMPPVEEAPQSANGLWRTGARAFFKDQRAAHVGDLITVLVNVADNGTLQNNTQATRNDTQNMGMTNMFGLENKLKNMTPSSLVNTNGAGSVNGTGQITRSEAVTLRISATVTQVLANGNMVVSAKQELRVNGEMRELLLAGIIRPQDIASDNTITHDRLAEARIGYGGRGTLSDVQTGRWGDQILDILLPF
jgi:flagellar L-ring protein precursor FlgH